MHVLLTILGVVALSAALIVGPDFFIRYLLNYLQGIPNTAFNHISRTLGWVERALYFLSLLYFPSQFFVFVGIWFALKAVGSFNVWQPSEQVRQGWHDEIFERRRAKFMIFAIGTGLSLLWTIFIFFVFFYAVNVFNIPVVFAGFSVLSQS